jgi:TldD protein
VNELAVRAIEVAKANGAEYADARAVVIDTESVETKNGAPSGLDAATSQGIGVRAIVDGAWGFASVAALDLKGAELAAVRAVETARASARVKGDPVRLAPAPVVHEAWATPFNEDPFTVPIEEKLALLLAIDAELRGEKGLKLALGFMSFRREKKFFASTEGSLIDQTILYSGVGYQAIASDGKEIQVRSYPNSARGQFMTRGYELVRGMPLVAEARRVASEAMALLKAPQCPSGETTLILGGQQLALQIHESCGHPTELDRVLGSEMNYAGGSFMQPGELGSMQYGSSIVNLVADATTPGGLGTFGYDDEGVAAQCVDLVRDGRFVGYLSSRETASRIGLPASGGAMRASGWNRMPLVRMTNVSLLPGKGRLDEIVADTDDGILMETNRSWSIDQLRLNFQFGTEIGWEIKKGKRGRMLKNPTYGGTTPQFWGGCDRIAGPEEWEIWGTPNCGKGQPGQLMFTGHGASPARFRNVKVGVAYVG